MKSLVTGAALGAALVAIGTFAVAQQRQSVPTKKEQSVEQRRGQEIQGRRSPAFEQSTTVQQTTGVWRASVLIGARVNVATVEGIGEITDLIIDPHGCVAYAIVSRGGVFGVGAEYVPLPWTLVEFRPEQHVVFVDIDAQVFRDAPVIREQQFGVLFEPEWKTKIEGHFKVHERPGERLRRGGEVIRPGEGARPKSREAQPSGRPEQRGERQTPDRSEEAQPQTPGKTTPREGERRPDRQAPQEKQKPNANQQQPRERTTPEERKSTPDESGRE